MKVLIAYLLCFLLWQPVFAQGNFTEKTLRISQFTGTTKGVENSQIGKPSTGSLQRTYQSLNTTSFSVPDSVCVNTPVTITNTSVGSSSYYWNFCVANSTTNPVGTNLGNYGFSLSVFVDYAKDGENYYAFVTNNMPGRLIRLDFGNSLLNTPTAHDFGNLGGVIPDYCEGIQIVKNNGRWYAIIVGDKPVGRIVKVDFGASLSNNIPIATNWGNIGGLSFPTDLHLFQSGDVWYGLTINAETSTITRFNFTNNFDNTPTGENLGNIGGLDYPTGIYAISKNGLWYAFVSNAGSGVGSSTNASLTRLDFGSSLLNTPTGVNLGNPGGALSSSRDITIYQSCDEIFGFVVNYSTSNDIVRLNFDNSLTSVPTAISLGNTGNLSFPHGISKLFRIDNDLYSFVTNVNNNTITRLKWEGCNGSNLASSAERDPPSITYTKPGTYNINLITDEGLSTQGSFCKQVVVLAPPDIDARPDTIICPGESVQLRVYSPSHVTYRWTPSVGLSDVSSQNPVATPIGTTTYFVTVTNVAGCSTVDSVVITVSTQQQCTPVVPSFTAPDTVCVNTPVKINNTSSGASSYFWNFCMASVKTSPEGVNLGNIDGKFSSPVYIDFVFDGGSYYGFQTNNWPGGLVRLDFGNSLLNTPTITDLGTVGGIIPGNTEGVQVIKNEGKWYVIVVGGDPVGGNPSRIVKVELGADITNNSPTGTNWGNIGSLAYPHDLYVFQDNGNWYGLTVNTSNNTITRFDFTTSFSNTPSAVNLGNIGSLLGPTGVHAFKENNKWYAFITNANGNSLTRLDFGNSLLNIPTGTNLGNPGGNFHTPWDIFVMKYCGESTAFVINAQSNDLIKLDFGSSITTFPTASSYGNTGNLNFPHCLSKIFRVGADLYTLIPNVKNNSLTRLKFEGCNTSSIAHSTEQEPPSVTYNKPGTYNISLVTDDGLPTQNSICKQVVVVQSVQTPLQVKSICAGDSILLTSASPTSNIWNNGSTSQTIYAKTDGKFWVQSATAGGCIQIDSFEVKIKPLPIVNLGKDTAFCSNQSLVLNAGNVGSSYSWQNGATSQTLDVQQSGEYTVVVTKDGCQSRDTIQIEQLSLPVATITGNDTICKGNSTELSASGGVAYNWFPSAGLSSSSTANTTASPVNTTKYIVTVTAQNGCKTEDSVLVNVAPEPVFSAFASKPVLCAGDTAILLVNGGDSYVWSPAGSLGDPFGNQTTAFPHTTTNYKVVIVNQQCGIKDSLFVTLPVVNKPEVQTNKSNDITCFLPQATLTAGGGSKYLWKPAAGLSDPTSNRPVVRINNTTTFQVLITTSEGCEVEDSITVFVIKSDDGSGYPVPNAFTPNGDGRNDCFGVRTWGIVNNFSMQLFNRWGEVVFKTEDPAQCWNGYFKGQLQPGDVYVYLIKANGLCGEIIRKGTFTLIR